MNLRVDIRSEADADAGAITEVNVAEVDGRVVGHIAFSPVAMSYGTRNWYGLGPVSVLPQYQRRGTGKKVGFRNMPGLVLEGVPQEFFFALSFDGHAPQGTVTFHDAFKANG